MDAVFTRKTGVPMRFHGKNSNQNKSKLSWNGSQLKLAAVLTMLIDHIAYLFIGGGILPRMAEGGEPAELMQILYFILRGVGRIAFPIFCFLLVEGFFRTRSVSRYARRLFIFALLSELPFDLVLSGRPDGAAQNVFFTLLLGLLMMAALDQLSWRIPARQGWYGEIAQLLVIVLFCGVSWLIRCDYDYEGILLIAMLYRLRDDRTRACLLGFLWMGLMEMQVYAAMHVPVNGIYGVLGYTVSFLLLSRYNGERGTFLRSRRGRWMFYWFYPVHLAALYGIYYAVFM